MVIYAIDIMDALLGLPRATQGDPCIHDKRICEALLLDRVSVAAFLKFIISNLKERPATPLEVLARSEGVGLFKTLLGHRAPLGIRLWLERSSEGESDR